MTQEQLAPPLNESGVPEKAEETQTEDTQVDWKVRAEAAESSNQKLENDLKAERGRRTRDQLITEMAEDLGGVKAQLAAIARRTASGETEALTEDFNKIDQASAAKQATRNWDSNYAEAERSLADALMDDDDNVIVDKDTITRLSALWQEAQKSQDLHTLYRVVSQAGKEARRVERQKAQADVDKVESDAKAAKKVSDAKAGVHDLSLPNPSGTGGGGKTWKQAQEITDISELSDADYERLIAS